MDVFIRQPVIRDRSQNLMEVKPAISNGSNEFLAGSFVKRDGSQQLAACVTADVVCVGWSPGASVESGQRRPETYWQANYPVNPVGSEFLMNITDATGHVGQADGAPLLSEVVIGQSYGIFRWTSGAYEGMQALNVDNTSTTLFQVTALGDGATAASDYNGLVRVKVIDSKVQA